MQQNQQQDRSAEILATLQRIQELTAQSVQMQIRQLENQEEIMKNATVRLENQEIMMQKAERQHDLAEQMITRTEALQHTAQTRVKKAMNFIYVAITFLVMLVIIKLFA